MKKLTLLSAITLLLFSCDGIFKERKNDDTDAISDKNVVLGTDKDAHGCVASAGYRWSKLKEECIRVFEDGYRLNSIEELKGESMAKSAFVVFEDEGNSNRAELYLPDADESVMLTREKQGTPYIGGQWSLELQKKYSLKKSGHLLYAGAEIQEGQITGDDRAETY